MGVTLVRVVTLLFASWTLSSVNVALGQFAVRSHCHLRSVCPPPLAWGRVCYPSPFSYPYFNVGIWGHSFHRVYYPIQGWCWPSYSYPSCAPIVVAPVCYRPVAYTPVYYDPFPYTSISTWSVSRANSIASRNNRLATSVQPVAQSRVPASSRVKQQAVDQPLTTYSPIWTESAIGLIDEMVQRGEIELAQQSLERMEKISTPLSHRVLIRQALIELVANRDAIDVPRLDRVMDLFAKAAQAGNGFSPEEFRGASLTAYLRASDVDLTAILDQLAKRALEQPDRSGREMLLLAVLLKLDGQRDRALLFANESRTLAARSDAFRWKSVLRSLDRQRDDDSLLAAKD
jgi:hypothetical protein